MVATPRRWNRSRSGTPCNGDQLSPMSITSPNGSRRAAVRPDSSRAIDTEYGHHAPSRPLARLDPRVNRTGLLECRACGSLFMTKAGVIHGPSLQFEADRGLRVQQQACDGSVDYETALARGYTQRVDERRPASNG